ncbi:hypothetical protein MYAM1_002899 [Malassezia yamatoensis]|uniref:Purine transporter n=1 Tax=Malassezia yamatoensis TaxID=253288 RepID=A0AAJ6CHD7_9BASI|nr:hypothetical protein MYAM1_002899 [Malassezia yamatoensis]
MLEGVKHMVARMDARVARSAFGRYFRLDGCGHPLERKGSRFSVELRAGCVTFAAMAYIIAVNADILTDSKGPCECTLAGDSCDTDPTYQHCLAELRRGYVVATAAAACLASALMGILANMPLGLAPGLGANAYFAYTVVGSGMVSYSDALAVIWLEGWIFLILSIFGVRQWLAKVLPNSLKLSTGAGIGLYLAFIGLGSGGLNVIGPGLNNIVSLAGCPSQYLVDGICTGHVLQDPRVWVGIFLGGVLTAFLLLYRVRGAFIIGILLVSASAWPRSSGVTMFEHGLTGDDGWTFFKKVATWHNISPVGPQNINWHGYNTGKAWLALISFLYIDLLDTTGTLYAMAMQAGLVDERTGDFEGSSTAYMADAISISCGSLLGCSPCTAFIESVSGIVEGGRTGITACVIAFWFFLSLFFAPIFASLPSWATGSVLVIVGSMMMHSVTGINWTYLGDGLPAFLTIIGIPFFYNIAYGLIAGIISFVILNVVPWLLIKATGGRLKPEGWDTEREPWGMAPNRLMLANLDTRNLNKFQRYAVNSAIFPPWFKKLILGDRRFWQLSDAEIEDYLEGRRETARRVEAREAKRIAEREEQRRMLRPLDEELPPMLEPNEKASERSYNKV